MAGENSQSGTQLLRRRRRRRQRQLCFSLCAPSSLFVIRQTGRERWLRYLIVHLSLECMAGTREKHSRILQAPSLSSNTAMRWQGGLSLTNRDIVALSDEQSIARRMRPSGQHRHRGPGFPIPRLCRLHLALTTLAHLCVAVRLLVNADT